MKSVLFSGAEPRQLSANEAVRLTGSKFGTDIKAYRVVYVGRGRPPSGGNIVTGKVITHAVCRPQALNRASIPGAEKMPHKQPVMQEDFEPLPITKDHFRCELGDFAVQLVVMASLAPPYSLHPAY